MLSSTPIRLFSLSLVSMILASGCCCFDSCHCADKAYHRASELGWNGTSGISNWNDGCSGTSCSGGDACCGGCNSHDCGLFGTAHGWCPDYPAMSAGWNPCCDPIMGFFVGLRNAFATCGCGSGCGPLYLDEWYNDPPACHDPCPDAYGPPCCQTPCPSSCASCGGGRQSFAAESWHGAEESWQGNFDPGPSHGGSCNCGGSADMSNYPAYPGMGSAPSSMHRISQPPARPAQRRPMRAVSHQDQRAPSQSYQRSPGRRPRPDEAEENRRRPPRNDDWDW